jgi:hypothetical protein
MIEKMETMDLKSPYIMMVDIDEIVQPTQKFHATLNEFDN